MELEELLTIPRQGMGVAGDLPDTAEATGSKTDGLGVKDVILAGIDLQRHDTVDLIIGDEQIDDVKLVEESHVVFDTLLIEGLQDHVPGAVGRVAGPAYRFFGVVVGVPTKGSL